MTSASPGETNDSLADAKLEHARAYHEMGRLQEAEQLYQAVLADQPSNFDALLQLGVLRLQQGRCEQSLDLTHKALALDIKLTEAHSNLATALHVMGRHEEAIASYENALARDSNFAEAHYGLGTALQALKRYEEAVACFERALAIDPDYVEAHCGLGASLQALKRLERSVACYSRAIALAPDLADAHFGRGIALKSLRRDAEAVTSYGRALALAPGYAEVHNSLGVALQALDRYDEALAEFGVAISLKPDYAQAFVNRGAALDEMGRAAEALADFERAFVLQPRTPGICYALALSRKIGADDPCLAAIEELAKDLRSLGEEERVLVHFALAKAYADLGRHQSGFDHVLAGNTLRRQRIDYDETKTLATIERIGTAFTPEIMGAHRGGGDPSSLPIFIIGMPRSGSTLVEQILASHPLVFAGGERLDIASALKTVGVDCTAASFPDAVRGLGGDRLQQFGSAYIAQLQHAAAASSRAAPARITDKMLANFFIAGLIHLALPNARILHACRDPIDTCLSCFSTLFEQPFACDLGELGRYYAIYARLMNHWRMLLPPDIMLDIQYEEVVDDLDRQARRIIAHCGLPWDDACLAFYKTERPVKTASVNQVRKPIYRNSVGRWRPRDEVLRPLLLGLSGAG